MKLLVRATNWIGDAVMSLPALREIRRVHEDWEITLLARPAIAELYSREGICDRMITFDDKGTHAGPLGRWRLSRDLRTQRFDRAILLPNSFDSAVPLWLAGIPERIGYDRYRRGPLLTNAPKPPQPGETEKHERFYYLEMLLRAGVIDRIPQCPEIRFSSVEEAKAAAHTYWAEKGEVGTRWVGVSPGAANSRAKQWAPERFAEAAETIAMSLGATVVVFGTASETDLGDRVLQGVSLGGYNLAGKTSAREFIDLTAGCELLLTNDSGGMHVAAALGVPTVAIFGPTDEVATGPSSSTALVIREPVECSPCLLKECPIDHRCMERVSSKRVAIEALAFMEQVAGAIR